MKKIAPLVAFVLLALASPASAETTTSGTITIGNPLSNLIGGVTENLGGCDPESPVQGLDGWWIVLEEASDPGRPATLTSEGDDADVWFFDADCGLISDDDDPIAYDMATPMETEEVGVVPETARYAVVDLVIGMDADFTFTVFSRTTAS